MIVETMENKREGIKRRLTSKTKRKSEQEAKGKREKTVNNKMRPINEGK